MNSSTWNHCNSLKTLVFQGPKSNSSTTWLTNTAQLMFSHYWLTDYMNFPTVRTTVKRVLSTLPASYWWNSHDWICSPFHPEQEKTVSILTYFWWIINKRKEEQKKDNGCRKYLEISSTAFTTSEEFVSRTWPPKIISSNTACTYKASIHQQTLKHENWSYWS